MVDIKFTYKALFYLGLIVVMLWILVYQEFPSGLCWNERRRGENACHSDVYRVDPLPGDTVPDLIERLWNYTNKDTEKVFWRRSLIYAVIASLVLFFIIKHKIPDPLELIIAVVILYILFYQMNSYYTMHFDLRSDIHARNTLNKLKENLGLRQPTTAKDLWKI